MNIEQARPLLADDRGKAVDWFLNTMSCKWRWIPYHCI